MTDGAQRIDKWLFFARLAKSRTLAQRIVAGGAVRVNRDKISDPARLVRPGDVLTVSHGGRVRVLRVLDGGARRGPASEAEGLYEDLAPASPAEGSPPQDVPLETGRRRDEPGSVAPKRQPDGFRPSSSAPSPRDRRRLSRLKRGEPDG